MAAVGRNHWDYVKSAASESARSRRREPRLRQSAATRPSAAARAGELRERIWKDSARGLPWTSLTKRPALNSIVESHLGRAVRRVLLASRDIPRSVLAIRRRRLLRAILAVRRVLRSI